MGAKPTPPTVTPTVTLLSPSNGEYNAAVLPIIQVQFNEEVTNVTPTNVTLSSADESVSRAITIIAGARKKVTGAKGVYTYPYYIVPTTSLASTLLYTLSFESGIAGGGANLNPTAFTFTTGTLSATPTAVLVNPANGSPGVATNVAIQVLFNESVTGVNNTNVSLTPGGGWTSQNITITADNNNIYTIQPNYSGLLPSAFYTLALGSGIEGSGGNLIPSTFSFSTATFSTNTPH